MGDMFYSFSFFHVGDNSGVKFEAWILKISEAAFINICYLIV